jgi:2-methylcitrate dehydratase PrpD
MHKPQHADGLARRMFLLGSAATLAGLPELAWAQGESQGVVLRVVPQVSQLIADYVTAFDLKQAPPLAIERARTAFIDTVGVTLAGSTEKPAEIVRDMVKEEGAAPAVSVIGSSLKTSPQLAALANGVASHALDFDFTFQQGQMMAPVIPALLPLAEKLDASQSDVLSAFMAGFEVCSRISRANPTHAGEGSWHATSTIGAISAAVACARLMKLPAKAMLDVIGIAVSLASGVNANYGTMTKPLHAGHAAKNGMMAAILGGKGFTANHSAIERRGGFFQTFARGLAISYEPFNDLGKRFDIIDIGYRPKRYPCGGVIHTGIDAALAIRDELGPRVADITGIKAGISKYASNRASTQYPADMEAAKFNLQYVVGYSLVHGAPHLASFEPEAIKDEQTKAMAQRVTVALDPEFDNAHEDYPTRVAVTLKDGSTIEKLVVYASGTPKNPMSAGQLRDKFFDCAEHAKVVRGNAEKIAAILDRLGDQASLGELWPLLRKA